MPTDLNQRAKAIVDLATGEQDVPDTDEQTDAATAAVKRKGGQAGGKARAEKLSVERRRAIAQKAASVRWSKKASH